MVEGSSGCSYCPAAAPRRFPFALAGADDAELHSQMHFHYPPPLLLLRGCEAVGPAALVGRY